MNYWLMKSEPRVYSIKNLERNRETIWEGVQNYRERNYLRQMKKEELAFILPLEHYFSRHCWINACGYLWSYRPYAV